MKTDTFNEILEERLKAIKNTLGSKAQEYAFKDDRLHNFKVAARVSQVTIPAALWGMALKHLVSVMDLVEGQLTATPETVNEKIGDMINYLILLEAVFKE